MSCNAIRSTPEHVSFHHTPPSTPPRPNRFSCAYNDWNRRQYVTTSDASRNLILMRCAVDKTPKDFPDSAPGGQSTSNNPDEIPADAKALEPDAGEEAKKVSREHKHGLSSLVLIINPFRRRRTPVWTPCLPSRRLFNEDFSGLESWRSKISGSRQCHAL